MQRFKTSGSIRLTKTVSSWPGMIISSAKCIVIPPDSQLVFRMQFYLWLLIAGRNKQVWAVRQYPLMPKTRAITSGTSSGVKWRAFGITVKFEPGIAPCIFSAIATGCGVVFLTNNDFARNRYIAEGGALIATTQHSASFKISSRIIRHKDFDRLFDNSVVLGAKFSENQRVF